MGFFKQIGTSLSAFAKLATLDVKGAAKQARKFYGLEAPAIDLGTDLGDQKERRTSLFETEGGILGEEVGEVKKRKTILGN